MKTIDIFNGTKGDFLTVNTFKGSLRPIYSKVNGKSKPIAFIDYGELPLDETNANLQLLLNSKKMLMALLKIQNYKLDEGQSFQSAVKDLKNIASEIINEVL